MWTRIPQYLPSVILLIFLLCSVLVAQHHADRQTDILESIEKAQWQQAYWARRQSQSLENSCCQCE